jgi:type IV secretory pathway VirB4 component
MPKNFANTQDIVDIENIRDKTVVLKDGSLRQIVMVDGINFALKSEAEQNVITMAYQNFINSIDFPIQIVVHSRKINIEKYLENLAEYEEKETSPILKNQAEEYREFVRDFVEKNPIMEKVFLVVVPFTPVSLAAEAGGVISKFLPFFGQKKDTEEQKRSEEEKERAFRESLAQLEQRTNQVLEGLLAIGLDSKVLDDNELVELFYNFYNPGTIEKKGMTMPAEENNKK